MCTQAGNIADNAIFLPDKCDRRDYFISARFSIPLP